MQVAAWTESTFPADALVITPHFEVEGQPVFGDPDVQQLVDDLAAAYDGWTPQVQQIQVKAYDAQGSPPNYPLASRLLNPGALAGTAGVRETAICLSFYSNVNQPRNRGRLYIPCTVAGITTSASRPNSVARQKVADLVPIFSDLGGVNVDWVVYSRVDNDAKKVSNWYVDDAWDHQRSRGLRPTDRLTGTTGG
jgi:hypothetical protein